MLRHDVEERARDAGYVAVGFCVLGFQQLQVLRRELAGELAGRARALGGQAGRLAAEARARVPDAGGGRGPGLRVVPDAVASAARGAASRVHLGEVVRQAEAMADPVLDGVERALPATARTAVHQGRTAAKVLRRMLL